MIASYLHQGSGLGNQLHRYVATRVLAEDKGYDWGFVIREDGSGKETGFKGKSFMNLDLGKPVNLLNPLEFDEKKVVENGVDIRGYDPEINFVEDNTIIDGEFQDQRYFIHRLHDVREWLEVKDLPMPDEVCVIGFRGGEFSVFPDLFLTADYWNDAIEIMLTINPKMRFEIHTDDPILAKQWFPEYKVVHDIGINWRSVRFAKHLIISNSSFYILPALLNQNLLSKVIAPRYWARRNTKTWALPQNYYPAFKYL